MTMTAPLTGNADLDAFLYDLGRQIGVLPNNIVQQAQSGQLTTPVGDIVGYAYKYIGIKYALDNIGTGLTDSPTNMNYFGVHNTGNLTESTNPADYTWYEVSGGFSTTKFLWYQILGGRNIIFAAQATSPGSQWHQDPGGLIDIDVGKLSDLTTDLGTIVAGELILGSSPEIAGTTMTGSGTHIYSDGRLVSGNSAKNLNWDGSVLTVNGDIIATGNIVSNAVTDKLLQFYNAGAALSSGDTITPTVTSPATSISMANGDTIQLTLFLQTYHEASNTAIDTVWTQVRVRRDGTILGDYVKAVKAPQNVFNPRSYWDNLSVTFLDQPSAGTYSYNFQVWTRWFDSSGAAVSVGAGAEYYFEMANSYIKLKR